MKNDNLNSVEEKKPQNIGLRVFLLFTVLLLLEFGLIWLWLIIEAFSSSLTLPILERLFDFVYTDVIRNDAQSFFTLYIESILLFTLNAAIYLIPRFVAKVKTYYIDLLLALVITTFLWAGNLFKADGRSFMLSYMGSIFAYNYLFATLQFGVFAVLIAILDWLSPIKQWLLLGIAYLVSVSGGTALAWVAWRIIMQTAKFYAPAG